MVKTYYQAVPEVTGQVETTAILCPSLEVQNVSVRSQSTQNNRPFLLSPPIAAEIFSVSPCPAGFRTTRVLNVQTCCATRRRIPITDRKYLHACSLSRRQGTRSPNVQLLVRKQRRIDTSRMPHLVVRLAKCRPGPWAEAYYNGRVVAMLQAHLKMQDELLLCSMREALAT